MTFFAFAACLLLQGAPATHNVLKQTAPRTFSAQPVFFLSLSHPPKTTGRVRVNNHQTVSSLQISDVRREWERLPGLIAEAKSKPKAIERDSSVSAFLGMLAKSFQPAREKAVKPPVSQGSRAVVIKPAPALAEDMLCSLNMINAPVADVLKELSRQTKVNLILLSKPDNLLTLRLSEVKLRDMLRHICVLTSLDFLKIGTTYVMATPQQLEVGYPTEYAVIHPKSDSTKTELAQVIKSYRTSFTSASDLVESIKSMFGEKLTVSVGPNPTSPSVGLGSSEKVTGVSSGIMAADGAKKGRIIVIKGPTDLVDSAIEACRQFDQARAQVRIDVTIFDISNDALRDLGLSWTFGGTTLTESTPKGLNFGSLSRSPFSLSSTIQALEKTEKAKLLASPTISVLDDERAFILVGNRINYPVLVGYSQANTPIFDKQEERVGIYLQVAASISSENDVTLSLYPQVSTITGFLNTNGASYPQIATREAQTTLRVKSGETIVMGGMLKDEDIGTNEKVPILGDIPIIKEIFTHRKRTKTSSQVVISITPTVIPVGK